MALKGDRLYSDGVDISKFMNTTGERGGVVIQSTAGSGISMDDANAVVVYPSSDPSGSYPVGVLLSDVVNLDLTRQHINWHQDEVQVGGKVPLLKRGMVVTNMVATGDTPTAGQPAFYDSVGDFTVTAPTDGSNQDNIYQVGRFDSSKDEDGYVKVWVNIV